MLDLAPYVGKRAYVVGPWSTASFWPLSDLLDKLAPTAVLHEGKEGAQRNARGWALLRAKVKPSVVEVDPTFIGTIGADYVLAVHCDSMSPEQRTIKDARNAGIPVVRLTVPGNIEVDDG